MICYKTLDSGNLVVPATKCPTWTYISRLQFKDKLAHDFLQVGFTLQISRPNNKRVISTFKFGYPRLTLKEGPKIKSDHMRRFLAHGFP